MAEETTGGKDIRQVDTLTSSSIREPVVDDGGKDRGREALAAAIGGFTAVALCLSMSLSSLVGNKEGGGGHVAAAELRGGGPPRAELVTDSPFSDPITGGSEPTDHIESEIDLSHYSPVVEVVPDNAQAQTPTGTGETPTGTGETPTGTGTGTGETPTGTGTGTGETPTGTGTGTGTETETEPEIPSGLATPVGGGVEPVNPPIPIPEPQPTPSDS